MVAKYGFLKKYILVYRRSYLTLLVCSKVYDTLSLENDFLINGFNNTYVDIKTVFGLYVILNCSF